MVPVPTCLVTGLPGADKRNFVAALARARPAAAHWALLDNDGGGSARDLAGSGLATAIVSGCACCSGQILLQTGIVQLLRRSRPHLLVIAVDGAAEPAALERVLKQPDLARTIKVAHRLCVVSPQWLKVLPQHALGLLQRQMAAADRVVVTDKAAAADLHNAGIARVVESTAAVGAIALIG